MLFLILVIVIIVVAYLNSLDKNTREYYNKEIGTSSDKFYTEYHRLIFNNPIFYKTAGAHLLSLPCDKCKTISSGCPLNTSIRARLNWNEENCFYHRYEWEHRFK